MSIPAPTQTHLFACKRTCPFPGCDEVIFVKGADGKPALNTVFHLH